MGLSFEKYCAQALPSARKGRFLAPTPRRACRARIAGAAKKHGSCHNCATIGAPTRGVASEAMGCFTTEGIHHVTGIA